jgi:hypothetical protein
LRTLVNKAALNGRLSADGWVSSFAISQDSKWVVYAVANDQNNEPNEPVQKSDLHFISPSLLVD